MNPLRRPSPGGGNGGRPAEIDGSGDSEAVGSVGVGDGATPREISVTAQDDFGSGGGGGERHGAAAARVAGHGAPAATLTGHGASAHGAGFAAQDMASHGGVHIASKMAFGSGGVMGGWPGYGAPGAWPRPPGSGAWPSGAGPGACPGVAGLGAWPGGAWPGGAGPGAWPSGAPMAVGSSSNADYWGGIAAATLNPDFSFSNPMYGGYGNDESQCGDDAPLVVGGSSARRGRGVQRGGRGGKRGGGRAGRPPLPSPSAAAATTSVHVTDRRASMADWVDEKNNRVVCELFADECKIGNRTSTHLNKAGYNNVIKHFKERTGIVYTRRQFKNKWDRLKCDYGIWKKLTKQTGIGWDASGKNIDMPDDWWDKMNNAIKGANRFKEKGLEHEDHLAIMFEDLRNTGDDHWCPGTGVPPSAGSPSCENSQDNDYDEDEDDDSEPEDLTPTSARNTEKRGRGSSSTNTGKKSKTTGGALFFEQMDKIMEMNERTTASCESLAASRDTVASSIQEVMQLVKECGALPGSNEHFVATLIFTKKAEREMFLTLETPEDRFKWLTMKHGWVNRNDMAR